jgi:hypothetical protein
MATTEELSAAVKELGLDKPNRATIGRLITHGGGLGHAEEGPDGPTPDPVR